MWRIGQPDLLFEIEDRPRAVNAIYKDPASGGARAAIEWYHVTYIYVGALESSSAGTGCAGAKPYRRIPTETFECLGWNPVFQAGNVRVFHRPFGGA